MVLVSLVFNYVINVAFFIYFWFKINKVDDIFLNWKIKSGSNKLCSIIVRGLGLLVNFKIVRIIYSKIFGLKFLDAKFENNDRIIKPMNVATFLGITFC